MIVMFYQKQHISKTEILTISRPTPSDSSKKKSGLKDIEIGGRYFQVIYRLLGQRDGRAECVFWGVGRGGVLVSVWRLWVHCFSAPERKVMYKEIAWLGIGFAVVFHFCNYYPWSQRDGTDQQTSEILP